VLNRCYILFFTLLLTCSVTMADTETDTADRFLAGYVTAILEHELKWERGSYQLVVIDGIATIQLFEEDILRRMQLERALPAIEGLQNVTIIIKKTIAEPAEPTSVRKQIYSFLGVTPDTIPFPNGELFWPLLADPKQPQFFISNRNYETPTDKATIGAVGFGESFGFFRRAGKVVGDGLQLNIAGGLFAQFNLDTPSSDLINTDYVIGLPLSYRHGLWSSRLRIYHQSSHLGDEFLLAVQPDRINLSYESVEMLFSYDLQRWRGYFGGEYIFHRNPADLKPKGLHAGLEYRRLQPILSNGRLVAGLDVKSWEQHNWSADTSLKVGLEFGAMKHGQRRLRLMAEIYDGHSPHGQFYETEISYYGLGVYLGF